MQFVLAAYTPYIQNLFQFLVNLNYFPRDCFLNCALVCASSFFCLSLHLHVGAFQQCWHGSGDPSPYLKAHIWPQEPHIPPCFCPCKPHGPWQPALARVLWRHLKKSASFVLCSQIHRHDKSSYGFLKGQSFTTIGCVFLSSMTMGLKRVFSLQKRLINIITGDGGSSPCSVVCLLAISILSFQKVFPRHLWCEWAGGRNALWCIFASPELLWFRIFAMRQWFAPLDEELPSPHACAFLSLPNKNLNYPSEIWCSELQNPTLTVNFKLHSGLLVSFFYL